MGREEGRGFVGRPADVVHRQSGEWIVADYYDPGVLKVFDSEGSFVRLIGRRGRGPGEYEIPIQMEVRSEDSLVVVDGGLSRITTLAPDLTVARTRPLGVDHGFSVALLPDERQIVAARISTARSVGLPLHLLSKDGRIVRSFGADPPVEDLRNPDVLWRNIAAGQEGTVWSAELTRYAVEQWDTAGARLITLERDVEWFQAHSEYGYAGNPDLRPQPGLMAVHYDRGGRVWTAINIADEEWRSAVGQRREASGRRRWVVEDFNKYYDGVVEILDPTAQKVIGSTRFDERVLGFAGDGLVVTYGIEGNGYPVVKVWQIQG